MTPNDKGMEAALEAYRAAACWSMVPANHSDALRAAITAFQAEAWQPIETAPKDEDELLVTNASLHGGFPQVVYWDDGRWHVPDTGISYHPDAFTHWRRDILPPPPKASP